MIDWVDVLGRSWGYQMRRQASHEVSLPSLAGRIAELGPDGACIRSPIQTYPEGLLGDALEFNVAFQKLARFRDRQILVVHYIHKAPVKAKFAQLGIARSTYWQRLDTAHTAMSMILSYGHAPFLGEPLAH